MPRPSEVTPELHSAGATVLHRSPFDELEVAVSTAPLDSSVRDRWVKPFYMAVPDDLVSIEAALRPLLPEVSPEIINTLLASCDWRPRSVGAFFVALERRSDFETLVGRLLLRSELCYAGRLYCIALAQLNTPTAVDFLQQYLRYYLTRNDLWFDQVDALAALIYLDEVNGTAHASAFDQLWRDFASSKPNWNLTQTCSRFNATLRGLDSFRTTR
jgi:uncharacterized protein DUF6000